MKLTDEQIKAEIEAQQRELLEAIDSGIEAAIYELEIRIAEFQSKTADIH